MVVSFHDLLPLGVCLATENLFEIKSFLLNFCEESIRKADKGLSLKLREIRKELHKLESDEKFLNFYRLFLSNQVDRSISLIDFKFKSFDEMLTSRIMDSGMKLIERILQAKTFKEIAELGKEFKENITLNVYQLFREYLKSKGIKLI